MKAKRKKPSKIASSDPGPAFRGSIDEGSRLTVLEAIELLDPKSPSPSELANATQLIATNATTQEFLQFVTNKIAVLISLLVYEEEPEITSRFIRYNTSCVFKNLSVYPVYHDLISLENAFPILVQRWQGKEKDSQTRECLGICLTNLASNPLYSAVFRMIGFSAPVPEQERKRRSKKSNGKKGVSKKLSASSPVNQEGGSGEGEDLRTKVVCDWGEDRKTIRIPTDINFIQLQKILEREFNKYPSLIKYETPENTFIKLTKDRDVKNCLAQSTVRLKVQSDLVPTAEKKDSETLWIPYENLQFTGQVLGTGHFGEVRSAVWLGQPVACKVLYKKETSQFEKFLKEIAVMNQLRHPRILLFVGAAISEVDQDLVIVTEFMVGGSLYSYIRTQLGRLTQGATFIIALDIALGMCYLHEQNCIHRDLNSKNILLDAEGHAKIADFGLSKFIDKCSSNSNSMGALFWVAPEVVDEPNNFTKASDVYSFAIILWEMVTGQKGTDLEEGNLLRLAFRVLKEGFRPPLDERKCPSYWSQTIHACWDANPLLRPTFPQITNRLYSIQPALFNLPQSNSQSGPIPLPQQPQTPPSPGSVQRQRHPSRKSSANKSQNKLSKTPPHHSRSHSRSLSPSCSRPSSETNSVVVSDSDDDPGGGYDDNFV